MKSLVFIFLAIVAMISFSCTKVEYIGDTTAPIVQKVESPINFKVLGSMTTQIIGDTSVYIQRGLQTTLEAFSSGPVIKQWTWSFADDNSTVDGQLVSRNFNSNLLVSYTSPPVKTVIKITGTDVNGKKYERTRVLYIVWYVGDFWGVQNIATEINTDKSFTITLACHKNGMNYKGGQYAYTGSVTSSPWNGSVVIAPADTNYNVVNGKAIAAINSVGKYILVRLNFNLKLGTNSYSMGVGKIIGNNLIWGTFWGPFIGSDNNTMIKFDIVLDAQGGVMTAPKGSS